MIVNYSRYGGSLVGYLKKSLRDAETPRAPSDKPARIFSKTPFVFVFDYDRMQNAAFFKLFVAERFSGSKILYCIFLSDNGRDDCIGYSVNIARRKELVLFGCACLAKEVNGQTQSRLDKITDKVTDYCPFERDKGISFPIGG